MAKSNPRLRQIETLIHRTYYLYKNTSNVLIQAECEEKLLRLFRFKNVLENHSEIIKMTGRILKRRSELRRGVLSTRGKTNWNREENRKSNSMMEQVAN